MIIGILYKKEIIGRFLVLFGRERRKKTERFSIFDLATIKIHNLKAYRIDLMRGPIQSSYVYIDMHYFNRVYTHQHRNGKKRKKEKPRANMSN